MRVGLALSVLLGMAAIVALVLHHDPREGGAQNLNPNPTNRPVRREVDRALEWAGTVAAALELSARKPPVTSSQR